VSHRRNITIEGPKASEVNATTHSDDIGEVYAYNAGKWVSAHVTGSGDVQVRNYSGIAGASIHHGTAVVENHGEYVHASTKNGHITIQSDRGKVSAKTHNGDVNVTIQAGSYSGDVQVEIDRLAGCVQVEIDGSASQAEITVVVVEKVLTWIFQPDSNRLSTVVLGEETFTKVIGSGGIFVRLTEKGLEINKQTYEVRPSQTQTYKMRPILQVGDDHYQQQSCHPGRRRLYDLRFWRFGRHQRPGRS